VQKKVVLLVVVGLLISSIIGGCTSMQTAKLPATPKYPERPITMIVPFSAGSAMDITARMLEKDAINKLGQPLVIVNKPGGTGTIG
jgi:tripartite-type tricarboxylate transporter receptor subunit TctC